MSNALQKIREMLNPQHTEYIGTVESVDHPHYKVLLNDGSGLVLCTSNTPYNLGARVFISNQTILRPSPIGEHSEIEV